MFWLYCCWLMIQSIAIVVFLTCRSPMISSRCPRPIGIIESIAKVLVKRGIFTDIRSIILGALISTGRISTLKI